MTQKKITLELPYSRVLDFLNRDQIVTEVSDWVAQNTNGSRWAYNSWRVDDQAAAALLLQWPELQIKRTDDDK